MTTTREAILAATSRCERAAEHEYRVWEAWVDARNVIGCDCPSLPEPECGKCSSLAQLVETAIGWEHDCADPQTFAETYYPHWLEKGDGEA